MSDNGLQAQIGSATCYSAYFIECWVLNVVEEKSKTKVSF